jgi:hypothetical protein
MASIGKKGVKYSVHMYALYFEKDQASGGPVSAGHRHDWEYALVWTKDGTLTHASFSAHGEVETKAKEELNFDKGKEYTIKVVYHKDAGSTHAFRPAKEDEKAENALDKWVTPTLVEWDLMKSDTVSNEQLRGQFNKYDFGKANCSFNDKNFPNEIAKHPPEDYPGPNEWKVLPPPEPEGLVARWLVLPGRDADRDNREVNLLKGQTAKIVVYLPEGPPEDPLRNKFRFNLKQDKRGVGDRGRTPLIGHDAVVSGDAHDWPSFGKRIYLGEREGSDKGFEVYPDGFYVDLVLVK